MYREKLYQGLGFQTVQNFRVDFLQNYYLPHDPNNLLAMCWKWQKADVSRHADSDLGAALARIKAKVFVLPINEDRLFPPRDVEREVALIPGAEMKVLTSNWGHVAIYGLDPNLLGQIDQHIKALLDLPVAVA